MIAWIIFYFLMATGLLWSAYKHGQPKDKKYNFWVTLITSLLWLLLVSWMCGWRFI